MNLRSRTLAIVALLLVLGGALGGQSPSLTLLSRDARRAIPLTIVNDQEYVALDDLAQAFQLSVREESGAITVTYKNRTIVLTPDQPLASISGRLVSLPARPIKAGNRWTVPVDFISRALAPAYDTRLDLRRSSRLLVIGDLRVPRVIVRHEPRGNSSAVITIESTPRTGTSIVQEPERLLVRFEADALDAALPAFQSQGFAQGMRTAETASLQIDLGPRFGSYKATTETLDNASRLTIELAPRAADPALTTAAPPGPPPAAPAELPSLGVRRPLVGIVAIDPGHGGDDVGAKGGKGTLEKNLTLAVARRLKGQLESRLGIRVILTREDDRGLGLDERAAVANNNKADLFISLHANASFVPAVKGATIYIADFATPDATRVATPATRLPVVGGGTREIALVPWDIAQLGFVQRSGEMARFVGTELQAHVPLVDPPIERAPFRVLESANMPAILIEIGYLTNPDQEAQLASEEFQVTLAQALFDAIVKYRDYLNAAGGER